MNYTALQNAYAGRADWYGPMHPGQLVSGKFQLIQGPWYHCDGDKSGPAGSSIDIEALQLRWFDRWLKDDHNGIDETTTPLHLWEQGANRWIDSDVWPVTDTASTYYLGSGTLAPSPPNDTTAADTIVWNGASAPCVTAVPALTASARCAKDDRIMQSGPHALTYTGDVGGKTLAGPINATLFVTDTTTEAEVAVTLEDIAPDGTSVPITGGKLLGSMRAIDPQKSWTDGNGVLTNPHHRFSAEAVQPLEPDRVTELNVEVFGTMWRFAAGHQLRLTLTTSSTPWAIPTAAETANLAGGVYKVQRNVGHASHINLPLVDTSAFVSGCAVCIAPNA